MFIALEGSEGQATHANLKFSLFFFVLPVIGLMAGAVSVIGGIGAFGSSGEPERYWVAGLVMFFGGILWWLTSLVPKFHLQKSELVPIFVISVLGMTFGLLYMFAFCGGECGGVSICHWYRGYPGYWFRFSTCMATSSSSWKVDIPSLMADILFWIDAGLILSLIWKFFNLKSIHVGNQK